VHPDGVGVKTPATNWVNAEADKKPFNQLLSVIQLLQAEPGHCRDQVMTIDNKKSDAMHILIS